MTIIPKNTLVLNASGFNTGNTFSLRKAECKNEPVGAPLDHNCYWTQIYGPRPDHFGWDNKDIIFYDRLTANIPENLSYMGYRSTDGVISAEYSDEGGTQNWTLPFAKFIDINNIIGARINNGKIEIVQRIDGSWSTLVSGGTTFNGRWNVIISQTHISVYVNNTLQVESDHAISQVGYFGISGHKWTTGQNTILLDYSVSEKAWFSPDLIIPCGNTGWELTESSAYSDDYKAFKAFNCTTTEGGDAWVCAQYGDIPQWLKTRQIDTHLYRLTNIELKGRTVITDDHMNKRSPLPLVIYGSTLDNPSDDYLGSDWNEIFRKDFLLNAGQVKSSNIETKTEYRHFMFVWENTGDPTTEAPAQIGYIKATGMKLMDNRVTYNGEHVTYNGEDVIYGTI